MHVLASHDCEPDRGSPAEIARSGPITPFVLVIAGFALGVALSSGASAQGIQRDVLTGTVRGPRGPVANATVTVEALGVAGGQPSRGRTDEEGRWLIAISEGMGKYSIRVTAIGMIPKDTITERRADRAMIVVDTKLADLPVQLDTVMVRDRRRPRPPSDGGIPDPATSETPLELYRNVFAIGEEGSLDALAGYFPGVMSILDASGAMTGFSALGLGAEQNRVSINGMDLGSLVPRDAARSLRFTSTPYDVTRGGFSGSELRAEVVSGAGVPRRSLRLTVDRPAFQLTDGVGGQLGMRHANTQLSGLIASPISLGSSRSLSYSVAVQAGRRSSDLRTLLSEPGVSFPYPSVSRAARDSLIEGAADLGLPTSTVGVPRQLVIENASASARVDWSRSTNARTYLMLLGGRSTTSGAHLHSRALPSFGGVSRARDLGVLLHSNRYFRDSFLNNLRLAARSSSTTAEPYLMLPEARVRVPSVLSDGGSGSAVVVLGGNSLLPGESDRSTIQLRNVLTWMSFDTVNVRRFLVESRHDAIRNDISSSRLGTYEYTTVQNFVLNLPASYYRSLTDVRSRTRITNAAIAVANERSVSSRRRLIYGLRLDVGTVHGGFPIDPSIRETFDVRPLSGGAVIDLSPRIGFYRAFGTDGAAVPGFSVPWGNISGGFGLFRNDLRADRLASAESAVGRADTRLVCVGEAVPIPDWRTFAVDEGAIPSECSAGAGSTPLSSRAATLSFVDRSYRPPRSWRGSLATTIYIVPKRVRMRAEGIYSFNSNQESWRDINFRADPRFHLALESGRPVYVEPSSIVPSTGTLTGRDARIDDRFGAVTILGSDLKSVTRQFGVSVFPAPGDLLGRTLLWDVRYTYTRVREQWRGFAGGAAGDPALVAWSSADLPRHQLATTTTARVGDLLALSLMGRFTSGRFFTPTVGGDVNGDGRWNDAAFVFSPASQDGLVASGMADLLARVPLAVRRCLRRQVNQVASRNSCQGPWSTTLNGQIVVNPAKLGLDDRVQLSMNFANILGGIDQVLHGPLNLKGWGQRGVTDSRLLTVQSFDTAERAFRYTVNPEFGATRPGRGGHRVPFALTLEARLQLGPESRTYNLKQALDAGRTRSGTKLSAQALQARIGIVPNPVPTIIASTVALIDLTPVQAVAIRDVQARLAERRNSIIVPVATWLAELPEGYELGEADERVLAAQQALFRAILQAVEELRTILTPQQVEQFSPSLRASLDVRRLATQMPAGRAGGSW